MKRKFINEVNWNSLMTEKNFKYTHIDDLYSGYISLIKVDNEKLQNGDGDKCLMFLPDKKNWCVSAIYKTSGEMVEWYFEITKNSIDEQGKPFYDPLYLDIAFLPNFSIECQREEFKKALATKIITDSDYKIANNTCTKIIKEVILRKEDLTIFFNKYLSCLEYQTYKTKK